MLQWMKIIALLLGLGSKLYPGNTQRMLKKIFLENAKTKQAKERLCWQGGRSLFCHEHRVSLKGQLHVPAIYCHL